MRSLYILGGAGVGKSTFMAGVLSYLPPMGPLVDLHAARNRKNLVTLRGHRLADGGVYLGKMRELHPGTDGLDRVSGPVAAEWLWLTNAPYVIGEGATLATQDFMTELGVASSLLVVHLTADPDTHKARLEARGTNQSPTFIKSTVSRSANLVRNMRFRDVLTVDVAKEDEWTAAVADAVAWVGH